MVWMAARVAVAVTARSILAIRPPDRLPAVQEEMEPMERTAAMATRVNREKRSTSG